MALFKPYFVSSKNLNNLPLKEGQFIFVTDTRKLYIDQGGARVEASPSLLLGNTADKAFYGDKGQILWNAYGESTKGDPNTPIYIKNGTPTPITTLSVSAGGTGVNNVEDFKKNFGIKKSASLDTFDISTAKADGFDVERIPTVKADGKMEVGNAIDFHYDNTKKDYATRISVSENGAVNISNPITVSQVNGNASTATKLKDARTISLTGAVSGSVSFDGSANKSITTTLNNFDASKITSGTIDIARLPAGALERCVIVADDTARFKLTTANVQLGDTVKVTATNTMYMVVDDTKLNSAAGYIEYTSATATKATNDGSGQNIAGTYIKGLSASGRTITYTKGNGTTGTITTQDTTYNDATQSVHGLMSTADKIKLDGIATGATKNVASSTTPKANGTATVGSEANFARGDHVHPLQTTISGNAGTATKLATKRTISLVGDVTGSTSFDGSADASITVTNNRRYFSMATCSTPSATAAKIITVSNSKFVLEAGSMICVKFTNTNSASNVTLQIGDNGTPAKIWYNNALYTGNSNTICGVANRYIFYTWDGTNWIWSGASADLNDNTFTSAYCSTAATTAAKAASCSSYVLTNNTYLHIVFTNANTVQGALTLNVNGQGAKPIYINGAVTSASNYTLPAGSYICFYDGASYQFRTDGKLPGKIQMADQLTTARTISLSGGVTGSGTFNGSSNLTIATTLASHTHNYAGSSSAGGAATSANKLNTDAGSASHPVYFKDGVPVAITGSIDNNTTGNAATVTSTTTNSASGTTYYSPFVTGSGNQGLKINNGIRYNTLEGTASESGRALLVLGNELNSNTVENKYGQIRLYGQNVGFTHLTPANTTSNITVYLPSSTGILARTADNVASATKLQTARNINGVAFDGTKNIEISDNTKLPLTGGTLTVFGQNPNPALILKNGSTNIGSENGVALVFDRVNNANWRLLSHRGDFFIQSDYTDTKVDYYNVLSLRYNSGDVQVRGALTAASFIGNATSATKLQTARTISLTGAVTGSTTFDGSGNSSIATTLANIDASKITSGVISLDRLPAAALERCVVVADDAARFKLTTSSVQKGDTVKVTATNMMYLVVDDAKLSSEAGYVEYAAGTAAKATSDGNGQNIANTYIKGLSVNGRTITYTKGNGGTGTITTQDTTYGVATTSANGLMSAADKTALNSVQSFAKTAPFDGNNNGFDQTRSVVIRSDGGMEIGRFIDFHYQKDSEDYHSRFSIDKNGNLTFDKKFNANGGLSTDQINANSIRNNKNYIVFPKDGSYDLIANSVTGQIQITLPLAWTSTMIRFTVDIYNYSLNSTVSYTIGGYINAQNNFWHCASAICTAPINSSHGNLTVRFCGTETASIITIGEIDTVWNHPKIQIKDILIGHNNTGQGQWESGWNITIGTTQPTVKSTVSNTNSAYKSKGFVNPVYLKLGNTTKSFDGLSYNTSGSPLSFTLSEIGAAAASHTHNYAGSSSAGGSATSAVKLDTSAGSTTRPVYFSGGKPVAITGAIDNDITGNAATATKAESVGYFFKRDNDTTTRDINSSKMQISMCDANTKNKPDDNLPGHCMTFNWDTNGYGSQLYAGLWGTLFHRYYDISSSTWKDWIKIIDSNNYTSYTVTKTGAGASGTWGINISGSSASCTGNATSATKLQTARTINGTNFDGTANITTANWGTARNINISSSDGTDAGATVSVNGSGNVTLRLPATIKATLNGNATSATKLTTSAGSISQPVYFKDGVPVAITGSISNSTTGNAATVTTTVTNPASVTTYYPSFVTSSGNQGLKINNGIRYHTLEGTASELGKAILILGNDTKNGTAGNKYGLIKFYGKDTGSTFITPADTTSDITVTLPSVGGTLARTVDNVASATKLQTARTINGVSFDGTANITIADSTKLPLTGGTIANNEANSDPILTLKNNHRTGVSLVFDRNGNTNWKILSSGGNLYFQSDYTTEKTDYFDVFRLYNNDGNAVLKGRMTAAGFTGPLNGIATSATKLQTPRTISLTGGVTGSGSFDGSANLSIATTLANFDASKITSGTINIARLPAGALERCVVVADDAARFKLTTSNVQLGDTVKVTSTEKMYMVIDESKLSSEGGYTVYTAGSATQATNDGSGQNIASTYIKGLSVSGRTITYTKGNGTTGTITTQDTTYAAATQTAQGLMSANDKKKLDGIATGATANTAATTVPLVAGTAAVGTNAAYARADHVHPAQTTITGNAGSASRLNISAAVGSIDEPVYFTADGIPAKIKNIRLTNDSQTYSPNSWVLQNYIIGHIGNNDRWRVGGGASASDTGFMEIATGDNGNEPIYVRQYSTAFTTEAARTLTLLDASGNTSIPGKLTVGKELTVTGAATLSNTLGVTGATTLNSTLTTNGATTLKSTLGVSGATTLSSTLAVTGTSTFTGKTIHNGRISVPSIGGDWIFGFNTDNASIVIPTKQSESGGYHPILKVTARDNHVVNIGGYRNDFGFYGFKAGRTENNTDWRFVVDTATGNWTCTNQISAPTFNGNATSATKLTTSAGNATTPIYFSDGKPVAITGTISNSTTGNAATVTSTITNPTSVTGYNIPFVAGSGSQGLKINSGISYSTLEGTASALGRAVLILGNSVASGTAGNKYGQVRLFGQNVGYTDLVPASTISNITVYLPSSAGTLARTVDNVASATKLQTARTINGVSFDGTANITIADSTKLPLTGGTIANNDANSDPILTLKNNDGNGVSLVFDRRGGANWKILSNNGNLHFQTDYANQKTDYFDVLRLTHTDGNAVLKGNMTAAGFTGPLNGTATTATKLQTARTIGLSGGATGTATSFDGSTNITIPITTIKPEYISEGYLRSRIYLSPHGESETTIIPFAINDIAYNDDRGGSTIVKFDGVIQSNFGSSVFYNGKMDYISLGKSFTTMTIEITCRKTFSYTNTIYIDFGSDSFRAQDIQIDVMHSTLDTTWWKKGSVTNWGYGRYYVCFGHAPENGNTGNGFNKIQITLKNWYRSGSDTDRRISQIGVINYASEGFQSTLLGLGGGQLCGNITLEKNNIYNLGNSTNKFANIYATTFQGNATTATTATKLGTATVGSKTKPIYLDAGVPKASDATVGSRTKPVYLQDGVLTECSRDIPDGVTLSAAGSDEQPVYINKSGVPKVCVAYSDASVNYAASAGRATKLGTSTVGSATKPIYLSGGAPTASDATVGAYNKPIYMSSGTLTACSENIGGTGTPIYMERGILKPCTSLSASYATSAGSASSATNASKATNADKAAKADWADRAENIYGRGLYRPGTNCYLMWTEIDSTGYKQCSTNSDIRTKANSSYGEIWVGNLAQGRLWMRGSGSGGHYLVSNSTSNTSYTVSFPAKSYTPSSLASEVTYDENGNIIPSEEPIYLGTLTYVAENTQHLSNQPVYVSESEIIPMTDTIGSDSAPMYLDGGEFRRATDIEATKVTIDSAMLDISNNGEEVAIRNNEQMIFSLPLIKETPSIYDVTTGGANLAASKLLNFYTQPNEGYSVLEVGAPVIDNLDEYGINEESLGALNLSGGKYGQTTLYAGTNESLVIGSERGANNKGGIVFSDYTTGEDYRIPIVKYGYSFNPDSDLLDAPIGSVYYEIEQTGSKWKKIVNTYVKTE